MKKGFTLIELLAVIVILAIIALIATPLVLKYIEKSRSESKVDSVYSFVRNLEAEIANYAIKNNGKKYTTDKENIKELGLNTTVKGENPDDGKVCISSLGQIEKGVFKYNEGKYYVLYDGKKGSIIDETTYTNFSCGISDIVQTEAAGLYDAKGNLIASWDELVKSGIILDKDYTEEITNGSFELLPGSILASNENLNKGVKLVIDSSVTNIGIAALALNTSLTEIIIPNSVTVIGESAFYNCTSLTEIIIPNSVTVIGESAFSECTSLLKVTMGNSVTSIGKHAFDGCTSLKEITINSVISIEENAFDGCTSLTEVIIPNGVTYIGYNAFAGCTSLTEVTIPNSLTSTGKEIFDGCARLKTINYTGSQEEWNASGINNYWDIGMPSDYVINYNYVVQ